MTEFLKTEKEILAWLDNHGVKSYIVLENSEYSYVVDVQGDVNLADKNLSVIPVKFNIVEGYFYCIKNQLTSLEFSPHTVGYGFDCGSNQLSSLEGGPIAVGGGYSCCRNQLTTLEHCPKSIGYNFYCSYNQLTSLEFGPTQVVNNFDCSNNLLHSLEFCPQKIGGVANFNENNISSLDFCPQKVGEDFLLMKNPLLGDIQHITDFKEIYKLHKMIVDIKEEQKKLSEGLGVDFSENEKVRFKL